VETYAKQLSVAKRVDTCQTQPAVKKKQTSLFDLHIVDFLDFKNAGCIAEIRTFHLPFLGSPSIIMVSVHFNQRQLPKRHFVEKFGSLVKFTLNFRRLTSSPRVGIWIMTNRPTLKNNVFHLAHACGTSLRQSSIPRLIPEDQSCPRNARYSALRNRSRRSSRIAPGTMSTRAVTEAT